ncbi:MAG: hypothetical protein ACXVHX_08090 [Solirubrobacteraceae bacterium]
MSYVDRVQRAGSPREAILGLAAALDELLGRIEKLEAGSGGWDSWGDEEPHYAPDPPTGESPAALEARIAAQHAEALQAMSNSDPRVIELPPPSAEKMERRRMLERQQLKLAQALGPEGEGVDWTEAYAKGGPWWLYAERRDLVMGYDDSVRRMMVADVEEDDPRVAYEMALDVLKQPAGEPDFENGIGALAVGLVSGKKR